MILADKIIKLRKKNGWSQEELAEKMDVSRQAVSKWEGAQTVPDLNKLLQLAALFGVTTDYLLKDEIEDEEFTDEVSDSRIKRVSLPEAHQYLKMRKQASHRIALATFLCILSPIPLIILGALSENPSLGITETLAGILGLVLLFGFVLCAVPIFILCGFKNAPYAFLEKNEPFETEYGVSGMVKEKQKSFQSTYVRSNILATCLCIFSPIPLLISAFVENMLLSVITLVCTILIAGIGVVIFIVVGVQKASMQKLLKEGEYAPREKEKSALREAVGFAYWGVLTAIFLLCSFLWNAWHLTWLIFAVGGVLFPVMMMICDTFSKK